MSKIISIGTAVPPYRHRQDDILNFMQNVYALDVSGKRKLRFLYHQGSIDYRHSVVADYSREMIDWKFYPRSENLEPFPTLETRMALYHRYAAPLSVDAIRACTASHISTNDITHLITVSCTGMSAPGLDLQVMDLLNLPSNIFRTSVNFMGCYAAIHAMKLADALCRSDEQARVMIVCTELCTLHFQKEPTPENMASSLLFSDGAAAMLVTADNYPAKGMHIGGFYSEVITKGKKDMAWELSSTGFQMTLSGYIPELIEQDFELLVAKALQHVGIAKADVGGWCIHPGGRRILEAIEKCLALGENALADGYEILKSFGNMSSPTILFVLKKMLERTNGQPNGHIFGAAFGPGLTMETFVLNN